MKIISLILCFCFSFNVLASSGTIQELEKHLDNYHYALTVEWDQKDERFYKEKSDEFYQKVAHLYAQGLTKEDIFSLIEKKSVDPKQLEILKMRLNLLTQKANSAEELALLLKESSSTSYHQGASWNGEVLAYIGGGLAFVAIVAYAIWFNSKYKCVERERYQDCDWERDSDGDSYYDCDTETRCIQYVER